MYCVCEYYKGGIVVMDVMHDLPFVNAGRGCKMRPYGRGILQNRSHGCLVGSHEYLLLFTPSCCGDLFFTICVRVLRCCECVYSM